MKREVSLVDEYEINTYTMAILPVKMEGKIYTKVLEEEGEFYVSHSPIMIMDHSCKYYGSNLDGRKEGTREIAGITHKPPVVVDPLNDIFFFPTTSPSKTESCWWISLHFAYTYKNTSMSNTLLLFPNKTEVEIPISKSSFENQVYRTSLFRSKFQKRMNISRERYQSYLVKQPHIINFHPEE